MRIQVKDLISYLMYDSKLDKEDEILSLTVDNKKEVLKIEGRSKAKMGQDQLIISFSVPFDAVLAPVSIRAGRMHRVTNLEDNEKDEQVRNNSSEDSDRVISEDSS